MRIVSICGSTFLIDELVHSTTTSGFAAFSALAASSGHLDAEPLRQADDVAEIAADLGRIDVDGADDLETGTRRDLLDDGGANRAEPEVHHFDVGHNLRIIAARARRRHCPLMVRLHTAWRTITPGGLTRDHVIWAYRLLLDRDPENEDVIGPKLAGSRDTAELRHHLITSAEFREKNPDFAHTNDSTVVIKEIAPGVRLFIDLSDHVIGLNILRGRYEQDEIRFVRGVLKPGDSAIDVGGHIGFFTMQMAAAVGPDGRVYAFEPLDANADLLERSIAENRFGDRVRLPARRRRGGVRARRRSRFRSRR